MRKLKCYLHELIACSNCGLKCANHWNCKFKSEYVDRLSLSTLGNIKYTTIVSTMVFHIESHTYIYFHDNILLVEETGVPGENHIPATSH
jgi:hypothetical protein